MPISGMCSVSSAVRAVVSPVLLADCALEDGQADTCVFQYDIGGVRRFGAADQGVRIPNRIADGGDAGIRTERLAAASLQAGTQCGLDIVGDAAVSDAAACHGDRLKAVELVANVLR